MNFDGGGRVVGASGDAFGLKTGRWPRWAKERRERQVRPTGGVNAKPEEWVIIRW